MKKLNFGIALVLAMFLANTMVADVQVTLVTGAARVKTGADTNWSMLSSGAVKVSDNGLIQLAAGSVVTITINGQSMKMSGPAAFSVAQLVQKTKSSSVAASRGDMSMGSKVFQAKTTNLTAVAGVRANKIEINDDLPFLVEDEADEKAKAVIDEIAAILKSTTAFVDATHKAKIAEVLTGYKGDYRSDLLQLQGDLLVQLGELSEARATYEQLLKLDLLPNRKLDVSIKYANLLNALSDFKGMESFLQPLLIATWDKDSALRLNYLGVISAVENKNTLAAKERLNKMKVLNATSDLTIDASNLVK